MTATQRYGDLELGFQQVSMVQPVTSTLGVYDTHHGVDGTDWMKTGVKLGPQGAKPGGLLLRDRSSDGTLLRRPVGWERIGEIPTPGNKTGIWRPVPPSGYVALGDYIAVWSTSDPAQLPGFYTQFACVKKTHNGRNYVREGECGTKLHEANGLRVWSVVAPPYPDGDLDEHLYLPSGCLTVVTSSGTPAPTPTTWVLDLPAVVEKRDGPEIPELTSHARPPSQTAIADRTVTLPYYLIDDQGRQEEWKVANSPFYKVRRKRHYELILYRDNRNGSLPQDESQAVTTGVTKSAEESFHQSTGMTVGVSVGVEAGAKPFGIGASTTVTTSVSTTIELGYERRTGVSTMREETKTRGLTVPPRSSACLWMEHHEIVPIRANGDTLGSQAALGFTTDYYVTGEYPGGSGAAYFEETPEGTRADKPTRHLAPDAQPHDQQRTPVTADIE